jgi:hypothetical protein
MFLRMNERSITYKNTFPQTYSYFSSLAALSAIVDKVEVCLNLKKALIRAMSTPDNSVPNMAMPLPHVILRSLVKTRAGSSNLVRLDFVSVLDTKQGVKAVLLSK